MNIGKMIKNTLTRFGIVMVFGALLASAFPAGSASASSAQIRRAQQIASNYTLPVGAVDGRDGANTRRGLCAFRMIGSGLTPSRLGANAKLVSIMENHAKRYPKLTDVPAPARSGKTTYFVANKTCQVMVYVVNGKYRSVTAISTAKAGKITPDGLYNLGGTKPRGWHCSSLYPESCVKQTSGRFVNVSNKGNMYNKRLMKGAYYVHGSTSVPAYPASAGCIRVPVSYSDWMYDNVPANVPLWVVGKY